MNCHLSEITELKYTSLIKMVILEEHFKWHLEAFASELFKCTQGWCVRQIVGSEQKSNNRFLSNP